VAGENVVGSVQIVITGDTSRLQSDFANAAQIAQRAGGQVAANFNAGVAPGMRSALVAVENFGKGFQASSQQAADASYKVWADRLGRISSAVNELPAKAAGPLTEMGRLLGEIASESRGAAAATDALGESQRRSVTELQATSGAIRALTGEGGIRALERGIASIPGAGSALQAFFPATVGLVFAETLDRIYDKLIKLVHGAEEIQNKIQDAFQAINAEAKATNDSLQVANDRTELEIAKIEKKPVNGIKLAIDEMIEAADQLGSKLTSDLDKIIKITQANTANALGVGTLGTGAGRTFLANQDLEKELAEFKRKVAADSQLNTSTPGAINGTPIFDDKAAGLVAQRAQLEQNKKLTQDYVTEIQKLKQELSSAELAGGASPYLLRGAIQNLTEQ